MSDFILGLPSLASVARDITGAARWNNSQAIIFLRGQRHLIFNFRGVNASGTATRNLGSQFTQPYGLAGTSPRGYPRNRANPNRFPVYPGPNAGGYPAPNAGGYQTPYPGGYPAPNAGGYAGPNAGGYQAPYPGGYPTPNAGGYAGPNAGGYQAPNAGRYPAPGYRAPNAGRYANPNAGSSAPPRNNSARAPVARPRAPVAVRPQAPVAATPRPAPVAAQPSASLGAPQVNVDTAGELIMLSVPGMLNNAQGKSGELVFSLEVFYQSRWIKLPAEDNSAQYSFQGKAVAKESFSALSNQYPVGGISPYIAFDDTNLDDDGSTYKMRATAEMWLANKLLTRSQPTPFNFTY